MFLSFDSIEIYLTCIFVTFYVICMILYCVDCVRIRLFACVHPLSPVQSPVKSSCITWIIIVYGVHV